MPGFLYCVPWLLHLKHLPCVRKRHMSLMGNGYYSMLSYIWMRARAWQRACACASCSAPYPIDFLINMPVVRSAVKQHMNSQWHAWQVLRLWQMGWLPCAHPHTHILKWCLFQSFCVLLSLADIFSSPYHNMWLQLSVWMQKPVERFYPAHRFGGGKKRRCILLRKI